MSEAPPIADAQPFFAAMKPEELSTFERDRTPSNCSELDQEPQLLSGMELEKVAKQSHGHFVAATKSSDNLARHHASTPDANKAQRTPCSTEDSLDTSETRATDAIKAGDENCSLISESEDEINFGFPNFLRSVSSASSAPNDTDDWSFDVDFDAGESIKKVTFLMKPLGLVFSKTAPVRVNNLRPGCHGDKLGIQPGWEVKAIVGEDVSGSSAEEIEADLHRRIGQLPDASDFVDLVFIADGREKLMTVPKRPFGISLAETEPFSIDKVRIGSKAAKLGVQAGWTMKAIDGQDLSVMEYFKAVDVLEFSMKPERSNENLTSFIKRMALFPDGEPTKFV